MKPLSSQYDHKKAEKRLQGQWVNLGVYAWNKNATRDENFVIDTPPPTVSGVLHMGHIYSYTQADFVARYMRMRGYNVLLPMGFDAFGLPAENAAIRNNIHPYKWTMANIERMRKQMKRMGAMFDWEREVIT